MNLSSAWPLLLVPTRQVKLTTGGLCDCSNHKPRNHPRNSNVTRVTILKAQYPYARIYGKTDANHLKAKKEEEGEAEAINEIFSAESKLYLY
jgi:hypothetical protein